MKKFIKFIYYIFVKNNSYIEFYFYFCIITIVIL